MKNTGAGLKDIKPSFIEVKSKEYREGIQMLGFRADTTEDSGSRSVQINAGKNALMKMENDLAKWLHDQYEDIAKEKKWETQKSCKVEFENLPENNKQTMIELAKRILSYGDF